MADKTNPAAAAPAAAFVCRASFTFIKRSAEVHCSMTIAVRYPQAASPICSTFLPQVHISQNYKQAILDSGSCYEL